jgi:hypothetical protein
VKSASLTVVGGAGGGSFGTDLGGLGASAGGNSSVVVPVRSGELLYIQVGGVGAKGSRFGVAAGGYGGGAAAGGFDAGAAGGPGGLGGGGGGGASFVVDAYPWSVLRSPGEAVAPGTVRTAGTQALAVAPLAATCVRLCPASRAAAAARRPRAEPAVREQPPAVPGSPDNSTSAAPGGHVGRGSLDFLK